MCSPKILRYLDMNFKNKMSVTRDSLKDRKKKIKNEVARIAARTDRDAADIVAAIIKKILLKKTS